jgi:hypothetical protein
MIPVVLYGSETILHPMVRKQIEVHSGEDNIWTQSKRINNRMEKIT